MLQHASIAMTTQFEKFLQLGEGKEIKHVEINGIYYLQWSR